LEAAEDAKWIFAKLGGRMPKYSVFQILETPKRIQYFLGQKIKGHGIDRKVAARSSLLRSHLRIREHFKASMPLSPFGFPPRQRHVNRKSLYFDNPKRFSYQVYSETLRQDFHEPGRLNPIDLDIKITRAGAQERVPDTAANQQGLSAFGGHHFGNAY
jgi:hypothetical protein